MHWIDKHFHVKLVSCFFLLFTWHVEKMSFHYVAPEGVSAWYWCAFPTVKWDFSQSCRLQCRVSFSLNSKDVIAIKTFWAFNSCTSFTFFLPNICHVNRITKLCNIIFHEQKPNSMHHCIALLFLYWRREKHVYQWCKFFIVKIVGWKINKVLLKAFNKHSNWYC